MIYSDITGKNESSSQLLDLLTLVANPKVYEKKIKDLEEATALNQKYVEALAPASEIFDLLEKTKADRLFAAELLAQAKVESAAVVAEAKNAANELVKTANDEASKKKTVAKQLMDAAQAAQSKITEQNSALAQRQADLAKLEQNLTAALSDAVVANAELSSAKADVDKLRSELRKKLDAFAKSVDL